MVKLTRKYKKKNSRTKSMKKHKVSKKSRKSRKQWKKGGTKDKIIQSENSAFFRPIPRDDIESGINNTPKPIVSSFSLDEYDLESGTPIQQGTPIPPSFSRTNTPSINNTLNLLQELPPPPSYPQPSPRNTSTPVVFQKVKSSIFIPGEEQKKISSENLLKSEIENEPEIIYEKKQYNDYVKNYPMGKDIPPPLRYDDYIKEILLPEKGIKYAKYGIQLYTLPNTNRIYDKKGKLFTEEDIKMLEKKYKETPFIDPDDLIVDNDKLGIYKKKNETSYSSNIYDKEGYLLDKAGLDALLHNYVLQMKKGIRERTSKK